MTEQKLKVQIQGCIDAHEAEIEQAVENALSNLMTLVEGGELDFDGPGDMAHVAEQMIRASMGASTRKCALCTPDENGL